MALSGTLEIGNKSYTIIECEYEFSQNVDTTGRPAGKPRGGLINITLAAPGNDLSIHEWMKDKNMTKDGKISLEVNENNRNVIKTISYKDAYCVRLYEYFSDREGAQMSIKISILPGTITFSNDKSDCEFVLIDK